MAGTNPQSQGAREVYGSLQIGQASAFNEVLTAEPTPLIQLQFPYSVNPRLITALTAGTGAATVANSLLTCTTGGTTASDCLTRSVEAAKYHPGQGALVRFTAIFDAAGAAGTEAIIGIGNEEDGFFFGYNGTEFGILHRCLGAVVYQELTISSGAVTASGDIRITLDGTAKDVTVAQNDTIQDVVRLIDATTFVGWETQAIGTTVVFQSHFAEVKAGAFTIADVSTTTGVAGSYSELVTGVAATDVWTKQEDWSVDGFLGGARHSSSGADTPNPSGKTMDVTKGNVFKIQYQWLGFGGINFFIEDSSTGFLQLVHINEYANNNTTPSLQNPTLPLGIGVKNGGTTSTITVKSSSMAAFSEGRNVGEGLNNATFGAREGFDFTTETAILAVKNKPVFQSKENRVEYQPLLLTFSLTGNASVKSSALRVHINPILGGAPVFADLATATSVVSVDTAGTTVSGGNVVATFEFANTVEAYQVDLTRFTVLQPPGTLIVFALEISAGVADASVAFIWRELF